MMREFDSDLNIADAATAPSGRLGPEVKPEVRPEVGLEEKPEDLLVSRIHSIVESVANRRPTIMQKTSGFILHSVFRRPRERRQIVQVAAPDLSSAAGSRPTAPEDDAIWQNFMRNRKVAPSADPLLIPETLSTILPVRNSSVIQLEPKEITRNLDSFSQWAI